MRVEPGKQRRLHDVEIGRRVEVPGCVQAVVTDVKEVASAGPVRPVDAVLEHDLGQDGVVQGLECLGDQGRTDRARRIAGAEGDQATPPPQRRRRRRQHAARQVDEVLEVVVVLPEPDDYVADELHDLLRHEPDQTVDPVC